MELWLVRDVPAWLVGLALIAGLPALTLAFDVLVHRRLSHRRLKRHNEVTGVIVATVGVAYAIVIGLCVVSLWEGYKDAQDTVRSEAVALTPLVPGSAVFGGDVQRTVRSRIVQYERDIIAGWPAHLNSDPDPRRIADLDELTAYVGSLPASSEAQKAYVTEAMRTIGQAEALRQSAKSEAVDRQMSPVMWIGVLAATVALLALCPLFGLEDTAVRRILLVLASAVIATNLYLVVEMNFPYYGAFSVGTEAYRTVVEALS
ncbi:DUF4239 domain-containing protein [Dactylosporangium matsuzakiense]|uniref:Membrane protein n=1 Tax=Dactylosporangium matsuzakiense TaxID=53360 RepID=A0A9W6NNQ6_9ACTN|nr:DUF4239 domain-containing protein [Dactylosporangium matsuzakiense]UWZ48079.1 DUF4239 domain-containing protein [Dactylosporangium matsuzakiense]GLL03566.1 membrane protein [Dactylosporangium matsuzakiense]